MKGKKMLLNGNGKTSLGKVGRICIFLLAIFMVVSCNNLMEPPTASGSGDGRAYLKISADETARTVVPQLDFQNLSFSLTGSLSGGNSQKLGNWNTYSAMDSVLIALDIGEWIFTLTASNTSGVVLEKSITKNVTPGTHILDFGTLDFSSGSGSVSVTLILPLNHGVATASAALYEVSTNNLVTGTEQSLSLASQTDGRQAVTYTQNNVPKGNYFLKFQFTQALKSDVTDVYQELVQVAPHLTSSATRELAALNSYYQVTLNVDGGNFSPDTTPSSFSRYEDVLLPTPTKEGYIFGGWYDKGDFNKTPVKTLPKGTDRDHNLTALWVQEVFVSATSGNDANFGVSSSPFKSLQAAVNKINEVNTGSASYTIKVMDNVDDSSSSSYTGNNSALVNIAPDNPDKTLNLTIKSSDDNTQRTINAGRTSSNTGRVMYVGANATVTMQNLVLTGGNIAESGGGVFVGGGTLTMTGGAITNNSSTNSNNGGGVYVDGNSTFTATGGTIGGDGSGNSAQNGGAIYIAASGKVELKGATISYNTSETSGGGVANYGTFEISSGSINNNTSGHNGGGVNNNGTLTMTGGTIANNTATADGGGVYVAADKTFNMTSGSSSMPSISGNQAKNGGGVYLVATGILGMGVGTISGNTATIDGHGVYDAGILSLAGSAVIGDELYWSGTADAISITSSLNPSSGTTATIRPVSYTSKQVLSSGSNVTLANEVGKFEVVQTDNISIWSIDDAGKLKKDSIATTFPVVNDSYVYSSVDDAISWIDTNGVLGLSDSITQTQVIDVLEAIYGAGVSNITLDLSRVTNLQSFTPELAQFSQYLGNGSCPISVIIFPESVRSIDWSVFQYAQSITAYFMDVESTWTMSNGGSFSAAENGGKASSSHIVSGGTWTKISP